MKDLEILKKRYAAYSTEKLIGIISNGDGYTKMAVDTAKKILAQRDVEIPEINESSRDIDEMKNDEEAIKLELPNGQIIFTGSQSSDNLEDVGSRMNTILDDINQREQKRENDLLEEFINSSDTELIDTYSQILEKLPKEQIKKLQDETELKEYSLLIEVINSRQIKIPFRLIERHNSLIDLLNKRESEKMMKKGIIRIIWGILIGIICLFAIVFSIESRRLMITFFTLILLTVSMGKNFYQGYKLLSHNRKVKKW